MLGTFYSNMVVGGVDPVDGPTGGVGKDFCKIMSSYKYFEAC